MDLDVFRFYLKKELKFYKIIIERLLVYMLENGAAFDTAHNSGVEKLPENLPTFSRIECQYKRFNQIVYIPYHW